MKKILPIVLIALAALIQIVLNNSFNSKELLVKQAMSETGNTIKEGCVTAYSYYNDGYIKQSTKEQMARELAKKLGINEGYTIEHRGEGHNETTVLHMEGEQADTDVTIITLAKDSEDIRFENYIMTEIVLKGAAGGYALGFKEKLKELYAELGMKPSINMYICDVYPGKIDEEKRQSLTDEFLSSTDARLIESSTFATTTCVYGYTDVLDEYVYQDKHKINVNIAFVYDTNEKVTYIYKGIPFVDRSF